MYIVVRELCHCFHDYRELLHPRNILDHVHLRSSNSNVPEEMQKQIVPGSHAVNVTRSVNTLCMDKSPPSLGILFPKYELLSDVALDDFVREVPTQRIAAV